VLWPRQDKTGFPVATGVTLPKMGLVGCQSVWADATAVESVATAASQKREEILVQVTAGHRRRESQRPSAKGEEVSSSLPSEVSEAISPAAAQACTPGHMRLSCR
jgi:hypothetical protein